MEDNLFNAKSRGAKHVTDKKKYKTKPKQIYQKSTAKALQSNWDRYESDDENVVTSSGMDFSILANAPITSGNHFMFKSDNKLISDLEDESLDISNLFSLDLDLLNLSLSTIPFHERCTIDKDYFTDTQINVMEGTAKNNVKEYEEYLKRKYTNEDSNTRTDTDSNPESESIDDLLNNIESIEIQKERNESQPKDQDSDLETWLDEILDS